MRWLRFVAEWLGAWLAVVVFYCLPRAVAHRAGRRFGALAYAFASRSREVALENLRLLLGVGDDEAERLAKVSLRTAGPAFVDLVRAPRVTAKVARRDVEIPDETRRAVETIRRGGRGAVLAGAHVGNWEFGNLCCPFLLPDATVIARPVPNPLLNRLLRRLRAATGQEVIHRAGAVLRCVRRVRAGGVAIVPFDLPVPPAAGAAAVRFFGLPTFTTLAAGYVAAATGAPVYLSYFLPLGGARYRFVLEGPLEAPAESDRRATALATTRNVSAALERAIRAHPGRWAWWMKRWRIRPDDATQTFPSYAIDARWQRTHRD